MISIKTLYYDVGNAVKGVCDRVYAHDRPKAVSDRPGSYIVVVFPSVILNNEMNSEGTFNDYTTTAQIEIYVRNKVSAKNPGAFDVAAMNDKVSAVMKKFPISTKNIIVMKPRVTLQTDDGDGFSVTIVQGQLRTR